jgi:hypothetical protein
MSNMEFDNKFFDMADLTASLYDPQRQQEIQTMNAGRSRALVCVRYWCVDCSRRVWRRV